MCETIVPYQTYCLCVRQWCHIKYTANVWNNGAIYHILLMCETMVPYTTYSVNLWKKWCHIPHTFNVWKNGVLSNLLFMCERMVPYKGTTKAPLTVNVKQWCHSNEKSATEIFIGEKEKWTNKGTDKQYVAVFCSTIQLITIKLCTKFQNPNSSSCLEIFDRKKCPYVLYKSERRKKWKIEKRR